MGASTFPARVLAWFATHGRKGLPWQRPATAYRVWISEVMLQQTQVTTVIPYFERFTASFEDPETLAAAPLDDVLSHWSGLGYYARARNLHKAARRIVDEHAGELPTDIEALNDLPGIGRSTAGAILALAHHQRQPILDGNVKRVLCRHAGIEGWPGKAHVEKQLWAIADERTPADGVAAYTQAMMDLGATLCTRANPTCLVCPISTDCVALRDGRVGELPTRKSSRATPVRSTHWLVIENSVGAVLLERRPAQGIWGGLWSFPECEDATATDAEAERVAGTPCSASEAAAPIHHAFSHYRLDIQPLRYRATANPVAIADSNAAWFTPEAAASLGLPAPARALLKRLQSATPAVGAT